MAILSVDLACRRWSDLGIVVLEQNILPDPGNPTAPEAQRYTTNPHPIHCEIIAWDGSDIDSEEREPAVQCEILAGRLNHLCAVRDIHVLLLDGPQAWKSVDNGLLHARTSERQLNTSAKTGLPGMVKPSTYRTFAEFCVDVYDALCRRGWKRLATHDQPFADQERVLVESYPYAAWQSLGLKALPSKRRARVSDLAEAYHALQAVMPFTVNRPPNHDQLQAIVAGMAGLALEARDPAGTRIVGTAPKREQGHWREGFIVLPIAPRKATGERQVQKAESD